MSKQSGDKDKDKDKGGGKKKGGKRRVVIQLPPGSTLNTMSEEEITKHIDNLTGKTGISSLQLGGGVDELVVEVADSSSPNTLAAAEPPPGWGAR